MTEKTMTAEMEMSGEQLYKETMAKEGKFHSPWRLLQERERQAWILKATAEEILLKTQMVREVSPEDHYLHHMQRMQLSFGEAWDRMLAGARIKRRAWQGAATIVRRPGSVDVLFETASTGSRWVPTQEDMLAHDWFVVDPTILYYSYERQGHGWAAQATSYQKEDTVYTVYFTGPGAEQRAKEYVEWKNQQPASEKKEAAPSLQDYLGTCFKSREQT